MCLHGANIIILQPLSNQSHTSMHKPVLIGATTGRAAVACAPGIALVRIPVVKSYMILRLIKNNFNSYGGRAGGGSSRPRPRDDGAPCSSYPRADGGACRESEL